MDLLGLRITGPAVLLGDSDVEHVLLLNPKNSAIKTQIITKLGQGG
jgi:hypothetical protein